MIIPNIDMSSDANNFVQNVENGCPRQRKLFYDINATISGDSEDKYQIRTTCGMKLNYGGDQSKNFRNCYEPLYSQKQ